LVHDIHSASVLSCDGAMRLGLPRLSAIDGGHGDPHVQRTSRIRRRGDDHVCPRTRVVGSVTSVDPSRRGNKRTRRAATARRCCPASSAGPIICSSRSTASATTPPQPSNGSAGNWRSHTTRCELQAWRPSCRRWRRYVTTAKPPSRRNSADRTPRPAIEPAENLVMVASDML
jgi:hypothetical protein